MDFSNRRNIIYLGLPVGAAVLLLLAMFFILPGNVNAGLAEVVNSPNGANIIINEMDSDNPSTDAAEFVELFDGGAGNSALDGYVLVFFNGSGDVAYEAFDLDGYSTDANGYFVLCGDAANVANCDLDVTPDTNLIQNGADAVALYMDDAANFPDGTLITATNLIDLIVYDTDDADDDGLLAFLNPGQPQVNENEAGDKDNHSNQRCPNGAGGLLNTETYIQDIPTPGSGNLCPILINEVDSDTPSTDLAEFVELYDGGGGFVNLDGYALVFFNGSGDVAYEAFDLDGYSTDANGYFVLCGDAANVANCDLDVTPDTNLIQNGADAVALYMDDAANFPDGTLITSTNLIDLIVYDTDDADDTELLAFLNPGQPQVNENEAGDKDNHSNQRCPNGAGGLLNTETYLQAAPSPGATNTCPTIATDLIVTKMGPEYGIAGEDLVYSIQVINASALTMTNVILTDTLPISATLSSYDSSVTPTEPASGTWVWNIGDVGPLVTETVIITATTDANIASGTILTNEALISTSEASDDPANNLAQSTTTVYQLVPIATARAGSVGEVFAVEGKVTVANGTFSFNEWAFQDDSGGIAVYYSNPPTVGLGDTVRLIGTRGAFAGQEQFTNALYFANLGSGPEVVPAVTTTAQVAAGNTEGWLVQVQGIISGLSCPGGGDFYVNDGSGGAYIYIDFDTGVDVCALGASNGDEMVVIGFSTEYNGLFEIKPRRPADVILLKSTPTIYKDAPANIDPLGLFTYTITVENELGYDLTDVLITDLVPAYATFIQALDGGSEDSGYVSWNIPSLAYQDTVNVRFVVQANGTDDLGQIINNEFYGVTASNYVTFTQGAETFTVIGAYTPIPLIQGQDFVSPFEGQHTRTRGQVTGFFEGNYASGGSFNGFFIQDLTGDGSYNTSDAIFVNHGTLTLVADVAIGDYVEVYGLVEEHDEYDRAACFGETCLTQIKVENAADVVELAPPAEVEAVNLTAIELNPPGDPAAADVYFEAHESMLVSIPMTATVVGPTSYGAVNVVRGDLGLERVIRGGPYEGFPVALRNWERYGDFNGGDAPNLIVGSVVENADGPLGFSYGSYMIITQSGDEWSVVTAAPEPATVPEWPAAVTDQFSVATFNTLNFDDGSSATKFSKVVDTILQMNGPAFIALQEIDIAGVGTQLLTELANAGYSYSYAYSHPDVGEHGVAVLWRTDLVSNVTWSTEYQSCSPFGSESSVAYDDYCDGLPDQYPTFSRRPVVVTGTVTLDSGPMEVVVIGNHFKSKLGGEPSDLRRLAQGELINTVVSNLIAAGSDHVIVLGDLNDFEDSAPLQAMYANGVLTNTWYTLPPEMRYSYIFQGVSQILDHIVVSPAMFEWLDAMSPLHLNADFPFAPYTYDASVVWRTSDHEPVAATFELPDLVVDFSSNSPVRAGQNAEFTDLTTGVGPFTYAWDFGDGSPISTAANPTHVYQAAGTYTVTLEVTSPFGTLEISHEFVVDPPLVFLLVIYK